MIYILLIGTWFQKLVALMHRRGVAKLRKKVLSDLKDAYILVQNTERKLLLLLVSADAGCVIIKDQYSSEGQDTHDNILVTVYVKNNHKKGANYMFCMLLNQFIK